MFKPDWNVPQNIRVLQTTRQFQSGASFDLSPRAEKPQPIAEMVRAFALPHTPHFMQQVHGNAVKALTQPPEAHDFARADALFTQHSGIVCGVLSADCLPVLLTRLDGACVAAVHCGWRGLLAGVLRHCLQQLPGEGAQYSAWLGPCIGASVYQVGNDLRDRFVSADAALRDCFRTDAQSVAHCFADLQGIARLQLQQSGLNEISASPDCTYSQPETYHSHRRDGAVERMASLIWRVD